MTRSLVLTALFLAALPAQGQIQVDLKFKRLQYIAFEPPLKIAAGSSVTRKINLMPLFPISDRGVYHVRANIFFADLNKFFYAPAKVFEVTNARPIWQRTIGDPIGGGVRTYSLMTNRF